MTTWYSRHPDLRTTSLEGEGVVLHLGSRRYFTVSESGQVILEALKVPCALDTLIAEIRARYDVDQQHATQSVLEFLDRCTGADLVLTEDRVE